MDEQKGTDTSYTPKDEQVDLQREKYIALYQARSILMRIGTMQERQICKRQLERMQKNGAM